MGYRDIHSHYLYGLDDGTKTKQEMEAMLDAAQADDISSLFATPHVIPGVRFFDFSAYAKRLNEALGYCQQQGYTMTLCKGAEVMYTPALRGYMADHPLPTLADSKHVLIEFLPDITIPELEDALELLERYGYIAVLAHIERYACLFHKNSVNELKSRYDVRYQVNANAILCEHGFLRARRIHRWFQDKLVDFIASDAHDINMRPYQMKKAYEKLKQRYGREYADQLTGFH